MDTRNLRARTASMLATWAEILEDERFSRAAGCLLGKRAGRRQVDDSKALAFVEHVLEEKIAQSRNQACRMAARVFAPSHQEQAMTKRLLRKTRKKL